MTIYSRAIKKEFRKIASVYVDDSSCSIGDVSHTLLGALNFENEGNALASLIEIKEKVGISAQEEIKWNSDKFTKEQRNFISEHILPVLGETRGFLVISEHGKQAAALQLATQLSDFCRANDFWGFIIRFDNGIVQDSNEFDRHAYSLSPTCFGWSNVDSAHDQLMQCADLFVGFQKLRIDFALERADRKRMVELDAYDGVRGKFELEWYVRLSLRHSLWGDIERPHEGQPWKKNLGLGVRVFSSVPDAIMEKALTYLKREYLGCIY